MLLLHVSALQGRHLQGAQSILIKLCLFYVISAKIKIKCIFYMYMYILYIFYFNFSTYDVA
jgi:hypothetical protein